MQKTALIFIFSLFPLSFAFSSSPIARFVFISEPQNIAPGTSSAQITVEAQNAAGSPVNGNTVCLEFTSSSPSGDFSTNEAWTESFKTLILTLGSNQYRRNLFYKDTSSGTQTISARAVLRPENKTCPGMSPEEWDFQWTATQQITISENDSSTGSTSTSSSSGNNYSSSEVEKLPSFNYPSIKPDAGEDRTVVAGALVEFKGNALGLNNDPLENARFWWNFGDGNTAEGRAILHTFRIPGIYTVGLHISSGGYAASDYLVVSVVPNQLEVKGVIPGGDGYIKVVNNGKTEIDFGGWVLEDAFGKSFLVPVKTIIAPKAEIALLNSVIGLFKNGGTTAVIKYPNGREALRWDYRGSASIVEAEPRSTNPASSIPAPAVASADVRHSVLHNESIAEDVEESEPESKELASAVSAGGGTSWIFLVLALALSIAASVGFVVLRIYGKT